MSDILITQRPGSDNGTSVILEWAAVPGAQGYVFFFSTGRTSSSLDGGKTWVRIAKSNLPVTVRALRAVGEGVYPPAAPAAGTPVTPSTIAATLAAAKPGDVLTLADGIYKPLVVDTPDVTLRAANRWGAHFDGGYQHENGIQFGSNARNNVLDGLRLSRFTTKGGSVSAIEFYNGGAGSAVRGCRIHDIGNDKTTSVTTGQNGVFVEVDGVTVEDCFIHTIGRLNPDNHDHGIYADGNRGLDGLVVRRCFFRDVVSGWAIQLYPGTITALDIGGNTFVNGNPIRSDSQIVLSAAFAGGDIHDNLFWSSVTGAAALFLDRVTGSGLKVRDNRYTQGLFSGPVPATIVESGNARVSVPRPVDPS